MICCRWTQASTSAAATAQLRQLIVKFKLRRRMHRRVRSRLTASERMQRISVGRRGVAGQGHINFELESAHSVTRTTFLFGRHFCSYRCDLQF